MFKVLVSITYPSLLFAYCFMTRILFSSYDNSIPFSLHSIDVSCLSMSFDSHTTFQSQGNVLFVSLHNNLKSPKSLWITNHLDYKCHEKKKKERA